jgi:hypothetical protein
MATMAANRALFSRLTNLFEPDNLTTDARHTVGRYTLSIPVHPRPQTADEALHELAFGGRRRAQTTLVTAAAAAGARDDSD